MYNERYKSNLSEVPDDLDSLKKALNQAIRLISMSEQQSANVHSELQRERRHSIKKIKKEKNAKIKALNARVFNLMNEREEMLKMIKRLVCSYEGDYQFKCNVEDFLRKHTDFRGMMHSSHKLTFSELADLRGGQ